MSKWCFSQLCTYLTVMLLLEMFPSLKNQVKTVILKMMTKQKLQYGSFRKGSRI